MRVTDCLTSIQGAILIVTVWFADGDRLSGAGLTRASKLAIVVATPAALNVAVQSAGDNMRACSLKVAASHFLPYCDDQQLYLRQLGAAL
jgi:hypothetical protein